LVSFPIKNKGIELQTDIQFPLKKQIYVDLRRTSRILYNMMISALNLVTKGFIRLVFKPQNIDTASPLQYAIVSVQGTGRLENSLQLLTFLGGNFFDEEPKNLKTYGVSLGLGISNEIVKVFCPENLGITCREENSISGFSFSFVLPLNFQEEMVENESFSLNLIIPDSTCFMREKRHSSLFKSLTKIPDQHSKIDVIFHPSILVVDDDSMCLSAFQIILEKFELQYIETNRADEALKIIVSEKQNRHFFDLILMDCNMPGMDGYECSRKINQMIRNEEIPFVPIMAVTANIATGDKNECLKAGMQYYISKPFRVENCRDKNYEIFRKRLIRKKK